MPHVPTIMKLHLNYRLYIAAMNFDINVLRIFEDYIQEIKSKNNTPELTAKIDHFEKQFVVFRNEIDELRHQMHILKMKLASLSRENKALDYETYKADQHEDVEERYIAYSRNFEKFKIEFSNFESEWLK